MPSVAVSLAAGSYVRPAPVDLSDAETPADAKARIARIEQRMRTAEDARERAGYEKALTAGRETGAARADDAALMALFCAGPLQTLVGAVSPELVWEGAQKRGLSTAQLGALANSDALAVSDLQWEALS